MEPLAFNNSACMQLSAQGSPEKLGCGAENAAMHYSGFPEYLIEIEKYTCRDRLGGA